MRLRILALAVLCTWPAPLTVTAKTGAAPPLPDRNPLTAMVQAEPAPPLPERNPLRPGKPAEAKPVLPGEQPTVPWTQAEIDAAKAKCKELLTGDPLDYESLPPIKDLRDAGAGSAARGRHRPEGRDRAAGDDELPDG